MSVSKTIPEQGGLGLAIDLGTSTIEAALVNPAPAMDDGAKRVLATLKCPNPQARWGLDVLSRINAVRENPETRSLLQKSAVEAINGLIKGFADNGALNDVNAIAEIVVAGNAAMELMLLGEDPLCLGSPPYRPAFLGARRIPAGKVGFLSGPDAMVYAFPLIGGFVGGDTVAVSLFLGLRKEKGTAIVIDIGTNTEIVLSKNNALYAASAAAGPAFEAGNISSGMTGKNGAIEGAELVHDDLRLKVIGDVLPKGICGSGLVDIAANLLKLGAIDETGRIKNKGEISTNIADRIIEDPAGNSVVVYKGAGSLITLTQNDIRMLQNAKAAIRAGINVLMKKAGLKDDDMEKVYIAGAFGGGLKRESLSAIGLISGKWIKGVDFKADAALLGASIALGSEDAKKEAESIAENTKYVSLSGSMHFEKEFIRNMNMPTFLQKSRHQPFY